MNEFNENMELTVSNCKDVDLFDQLYNSETPHYLISDKLWHYWVSSLRKSDVRYKTIKEIADTLGLNWPNEKRHQIISLYLNKDLSDLFDLSDIDIRRTIFLCIANLAIFTLQLLDEKQTETSQLKIIDKGIEDESNLTSSKDNCYDNADKDIKLLFENGLGIVSISRKTKEYPYSVYKKLVEMKLLKRRTTGGYNLSKIPAILRDQLKQDGLNFGIMCNGLNIRPAILEKAIVCMTSGTPMPEKCLKAIELLKIEYPDVITNITDCNKIPLLPNITTIIQSETRDFSGELRTDEHTRFVKQLTISSNPENLITENIWHNWAIALVSKPFAREMVINTARRHGLKWPVYENNRRFDDYLKMSFSKIKDILSVESKRTLIICVAIEASKVISQSTPDTANMRAKSVSVNRATSFISPPEDHQYQNSFVRDPLAPVKIQDHEAPIVNGNEITFADYSRFLLRELAIAVNPVSLITEEIWSRWGTIFKGHAFQSELIIHHARKHNLHWPITKKTETFSKYLCLPLKTFREMFGSDSKRTILICIAHAANNMVVNDTQYDLNLQSHKLTRSSCNVRDPSFEEVFDSSNPIKLITDDIWSKWVRLLKNSDLKSSCISDVICEIGVLYWQPQWKFEKIEDYLDFSLEDLRTIRAEGKARTIVICFAKLSSDLSSKENIHPEGDVSKPIDLSSVFQTLFRDSNNLVLSTSQWNLICVELSSSPFGDLNIGEAANAISSTLKFNCAYTVKQLCNKSLSEIMLLEPDVTSLFVLIFWAHKLSSLLNLHTTPQSSLSEIIVENYGMLSELFRK